MCGVSASGEAERGALVDPIKSETRMAQECGAGELGRMAVPTGNYVRQY